MVHTGDSSPININCIMYPLMHAEIRALVVEGKKAQIFTDHKLLPSGKPQRENNRSHRF